MALSGDVIGSMSGTVVATVGGSSADNVHTAEALANGATSDNVPNTIVKRDASGNINVSAVYGTLAGSLSGDVNGPATGNTVDTVGGSTAANIHLAEIAANAATSANTAGKIVARDGSGDFAAHTITANLTGNASGSAASFTGALLGDVTGTQGATVVSLVGGSSAANVHAAELLANAAATANTPSTIVKRDASGNFNAGTISANLNGDVTGNVTGNLTGNASGSAASFTGSLAGNVTGTQGATVVSTVPAAALPNPSATTLGGVKSLASVTSKWINQISTAGLPSATQPAFSDISGSVAASQLPNPSASSLGGVQSIAATSHQFLNSISTAGVPSAAQPAFSDISGSVAASQLPNPSATTLGGVQSKTATSHQFLTSISTSGVPAAAQPDFTDLSGSVAASQMPALTGDVTTSAGAVATTVVTVGGSTASLVHSAELAANAATDANTASAIVKRDGSGNFSAGTVSAKLLSVANAADASMTQVLKAGSTANQANAIDFQGFDGTSQLKISVSATKQPTITSTGTNFTVTSGSSAAQSNVIFQNSADNSHYVVCTGGSTAEQSRGYFITTKALGNAALWQVDASGNMTFSCNANQIISANNAGRITGLGTTGQGVKVAGQLLLTQNAPTYGATVTIDASQGNQFTVTATNGTAFTVAAPTNPLTGQIFNLTIKNTSGGALGAITWNAVFKMATWTSPATGNNRSISFFYDGTNWIEFARTPNDVPN